MLKTIDHRAKQFADKFFDIAEICRSSQGLASIQNHSISW